LVLEPKPPNPPPIAVTVLKLVPAIELLTPLAAAAPPPPTITVIIGVEDTLTVLYTIPPAPPPPPLLPAEAAPPPPPPPATTRYSIEETNVLIIGNSVVVEPIILNTESDADTGMFVGIPVNWNIPPVDVNDDVVNPIAGTDNWY
jgi:hypothetical protein